MIKIENTNVCGWEAATRGMRNPLNSWDNSDSFQCDGIYTMPAKITNWTNGACFVNGLKVYRIQN